MVRVTNVTIIYNDGKFYILSWFWGSGEEVKSLWSTYVGLHMRYKGEYKKWWQLELKQNFKRPS